MLPDCVALKKTISEKLMMEFRQTVNLYLGFVSESPRSIIHEGRRTVIVRESGEVDETILRQASAQFAIQIEEIPTISYQELRDRINQSAQEMAKQMSEGFFSDISNAVDKIGNTVDAKGKGFTPELILEMLEKIWINFDAEGNPQMPTLTISPAQGPQVRQAFEAIDADPKLSARFSQLIEKKREEWRVREASRKLVG